MKKPIHVTVPMMPSLEKMTIAMKELWESKRLTNYGEFHASLESKLASYLGAPYTSLTSNGTLALMIALKALCPPGSEVITTPFSFIATTNAIEWCGLTPVFCDIEPKTFTLDPDNIENHITSKTAAILPVHVYGYPCDVEAIDEIARRYSLRVIYDAAHAFGVRYRGRPITDWGDASVLSFHATKLFNTVEGGAVCSSTSQSHERIRSLRNFGIRNETDIDEIGINAKMNELLALWGILLLDEVEHEVIRRKEIDQLYYQALSKYQDVVLPKINDEVEWNYSYYPIRFMSGGRHLRDRVYDKLREEGIFSRKYFYPLITQVQSQKTYIDVCTPVATEISDSILCLPMYGDLDRSAIPRIADVVGMFM